MSHILKSLTCPSHSLFSSRLLPLLLPEKHFGNDNVANNPIEGVYEHICKCLLMLALRTRSKLLFELSLLLVEFILVLLPVLLGIELAGVASLKGVEFMRRRFLLLHFLLISVIVLANDPASERATGSSVTTVDVMHPLT